MQGGAGQCRAVQGRASTYQNRGFTVDRLTFENVRDLPVWRSAILQNKHHRAYVAPRLVRKGVLTGGQLLDDQLQVLPTCAKLMGSTWVPVYATALERFQAKVIYDWSRPTAWLHGWAKSLTLQHIAPSPQVTHRRTKDVWSQFWNWSFAGT